MSKKKILLCTILILIFGTIDIFGAYVAFASSITYPQFTYEQRSSPAIIAQGLQDSNIPFLIVSGSYNYQSVYGTLILVYVGMDTTSEFTVTNGVLHCSTAYDIYQYTNVSTSGLRSFFTQENTGGRVLDIVVNNNNLYSALFSTIGYGSTTTTEYDYYCYNPNGEEITDFGENLIVPPISNADKSLIDMDVNTMRIVKPVSNATLDHEDKIVFADQDFFEFELQIKLAIPSDITLDSHTRSPMWGSNDLDQFVQRNKDCFIGSMTASFPNVLFSDTKEVTTLGDRRDWINNHFVIFICKGRVLLDTPTPLLNTKLTLGCNVITDFYSITSADYLWLNDTVEFNLTFHKDVDGNGIDDDTGEVIPTDSVVDTDGDGQADDAKIDTDSFFEKFTDDMKKVPEYSNDVGDLYSQLFGMFPPPVPQLVVTGICVIIFVSVIGFIRG